MLRFARLAGVVVAWGLVLAPPWPASVRCLYRGQSTPGLDHQGRRGRWVSSLGRPLHFRRQTSLGVAGIH